MPSSSRLLASASTDDFDWTGLESVTLGIRKYLERPSRRIAAVYFPEGDSCSAITPRPMRPMFKAPERASAYLRRNCTRRPRPAYRFATRC